MSLWGHDDPRALRLGRSKNGGHLSRGSVAWPHVLVSSGMRVSKAAPGGASLGTAWQSRENLGRAGTLSFSATADPNPKERSRLRSGTLGFWPWEVFLGPQWGAALYRFCSHKLLGDPSPPTQ